MKNGTCHALCWRRSVTARCLRHCFLARQMGLRAVERTIGDSSISTHLWDDGELVDITSGLRLRLDGSVRPRTRSAAYPFDRCRSASGRYTLVDSPTTQHGSGRAMRRQVRLSERKVDKFKSLSQTCSFRSMVSPPESTRPLSSGASARNSGTGCGSILPDRRF